MAVVSAGFKWLAPPSKTLIPRLRFMNARMLLKIQRNALLLAQRMENEAKALAAWKDESKKARAGLIGTATPQGKDGVLIVLAHGEGTVSRRGYPYGIALETHNGGRFAIIMPTMQRHYGTGMAELTFDLMSF